MMAVDRGATEYGGGDGNPQRFPDGSPRVLSVSEAARVRRMAGMRGDLPSTTVPRTQTLKNGAGVIESSPFAPDVEAIKDLRERTNRYSDDAGSIGEDVATS